MKANFLTSAIGSILFTVLGHAQELHTHSNAASIANEANATTGWTGGSTITSDSSDPFGGTYALKVVAKSTNTLDRRATYNFTAVNGETYDISIWAKAGTQTTDPAFALWSGLSGFSTTVISGSTWTEYTFTVTATSTNPSIRVFTGSDSSSVGDEVYIDRVSITPHSSADTEAPTSPTLTISGSTETRVDLSWTTATDNVGVTGYNVYQDNVAIANDIPDLTYPVTGLTAATAYDFKVRALDAAGNESGDSNIVSVTTTSGSGGGSGSTSSSIWYESGSTASYSGEVAIGRASVPSGYKLAVDGHIRTREIRVDQDTWPDYVFEEGYDLPTLEEIQKHIQEKGHLPNIPSAKEVESNGLELGEMNRLLLEKIEELTLYVLELKHEIKTLKTQTINH